MALRLDMSVHICSGQPYLGQPQDSCNSREKRFSAVNIDQ